MLINIHRIHAQSAHVPVAKLPYKDPSLPVEVRPAEADELDVQAAPNAAAPHTLLTHIRTQKRPVDMTVLVTVQRPIAPVM